MLEEIYVTQLLLDEELKSEGSSNYRNSMKILYDIITEWNRRVSEQIRDYTNEMEIPYFRNTFLPRIVIGTKEEVIKERRKIKRNISDLEKIRLQLINMISSNEYCSKLIDIETELEKLKSYCNPDDKYARYAFYAPNECWHELSVSHLQIKILEHGEIHGNFPGYFESIKDCISLVRGGGNTKLDRFVMMPYDLVTSPEKDDDFFKLYFTPKFYHALYHELFHSLLSDFFRSDGYKIEGRDNNNINEGLPEIYSEICYNEFMENKLFRKTKKEGHERKHSPTYKKKFYQDYMDHLDPKHPYHTYYKHAAERVKTREHAIFLKFTMELIQKGMYSNSKELLHCGEFTDNWEQIFTDTCNKFL